MKKQDKILEVCGDAQPETATQVENGATELVFILDKSGSMSGMERDVIGGFNSMIEKQKSVGGTAYVSTILFSNFSEVLHDRKNLEEIEPLTAQDFQVGGCTALLDAIGGAVNHIGNIHKYARKEDVPEKTLFLLALIGGSVGAWAGMYTFRHKTRHWYFVWGIPAILLAQVVLAVWLTVQK